MASSRPSVLKRNRETQRLEKKQKKVARRAALAARTDSHAGQLNENGQLVIDVDALDAE